MNVAEVYTKYQIGRLIVDDEQKGQYRAEYGKQILLNLSERLISRYEGGWTVDTLKPCQKRRLPMQELKDVVEKLRNDVPLEGDVVVEEAIESMIPTYPSSKHGV